MLQISHVLKVIANYLDIPQIRHVCWYIGVSKEKKTYKFVTNLGTSRSANMKWDLLFNHLPHAVSHALDNFYGCNGVKMPSKHDQLTQFICLFVVFLISYIIAYDRTKVMATISVRQRINAAE